MDENVVDQEEQTAEVIRELRDVRPAHYLFKIKNFTSLLSNPEIDKYESTDFEVSGYKWKLCLYPKGVDEKNKHISLYLVLSKSNELTLHKEVNVYLKLFVYNQIQDKYLTVQDAKGRISRFRGAKTVFGFDQLLPLDVFNDESNGYLIDDRCIFGAEVFVVEPISKGECASVVNDLSNSNNKYTWNVQNFADLKQESCNSPVFDIGGYKWTLTMYPNGNSKEKGKSLALFLELEDLEALNPGLTLYVEFVLRLKDKLCQKRTSHHFSTSASSWGFANLISLRKLNDASKGYLINGGIILEVQIYFIAKVKEFS